MYILQKFNQVVSLCQQLGVENYDIISLPQLIPICYVDILYSSLMILQKVLQTNIHPNKLAVLIRKILPAVFTFFTKLQPFFEKSILYHIRIC